MTPLTNTDRKTGRKAMEAALTPMQKALRKYGSGRPPNVPKSSPLAAVALATEQRARLQNILQSEPGLLGARISSMGIVVRLAGVGKDAPASLLLVTEGEESAAIQGLESFKAAGLPYVISGVIFSVRDDSTPSPTAFGYLIERTPEGDAALKWTFDRQLSGAVKKANN